jgi:hypothetical protein
LLGTLTLQKKSSAKEERDNILDFSPLFFFGFSKRKRRVEKGCDEVGEEDMNDH